MNRRELVVSGARITALAALAAAAGLLLGRRGNADDACRPEPCSGCAAFDGCSLPRAVAAKSEVKRAG